MSELGTVVFSKLRERANGHGVNLADVAKSVGISTATLVDWTLTEAPVSLQDVLKITGELDQMDLDKAFPGQIIPVKRPAGRIRTFLRRVVN